MKNLVSESIFSEYIYQMWPSGLGCWT